MTNIEKTRDDGRSVPREVAEALADFIEEKVPGSQVFRSGNWIVVT